MKDTRTYAMSLRSRWGVAAAVAMLASSAPAYATSGFPRVIKQELDTPSTAECSLCHASAAGGGRVTQPFGEIMQDRGLRPWDENSLRTALQALEAEGVDSDGDGLGDIEELRMGLDPNFDGDADLEPPSYGCSVPRQAPSGPLPVLGLTLLAAATFFVRRTL